MTISNRIIKLLKENNLNQKFLSDNSSISGPQISNYLNKGQIPNAITIGEIAKLLNVTTDYLIFGDDIINDPLIDKLLYIFNKLDYDNKLKAISEVNSIEVIQELKKLKTPE